MINLKKIKPNKKNPRIIKTDKFKKLVQSVKDFSAMMELRPIVVDKDFNILGGNMRFLALKELGYSEIPDNWIKIAENLTDDEKKRFIVEDNLNFGEWDFDMLANEWNISELIDWGFDSYNFDIDVEVFEDIEINKKANFIIAFNTIEELEEFKQKNKIQSDKINAEKYDITIRKK